MSGDRWGSEDPPLEAYSRVTNPERFAPLHGIAKELLDRLELEFDVERAEGHGLDPEVEGRPDTAARPAIVLTPRNSDEAPLVVGFSSFPGVRVRLGCWYTRGFPLCGCDACDENLEEEAERLTWLVENATEGRFRETIWIPDSGSAWRRTEFWSTDGSSESSDSAVDREEAQRLLAGRQRSAYRWAPWSRRNARAFPERAAV
jgi:hypothetical protein